MSSPREQTSPVGAKKRLVNRRARASSVRGIQKTVRFDAEEFAAISEAAASMNVSPVSYIAMAAVATAQGDDSPAANTPLQEALIELMRTRNQVVKIGTNLNQLVRSLQSTGVIPESIDWAVRVSRNALESVEAAAERAQKILSRSR